MSFVRRGVHHELEAAANKLLKDSLKGVTRYSEKSDILTPWKEQMRARREVHVRSGTPDPTVRRGMYNRAASLSSPHLNSRDGISPAHRTGRSGSTLAAFVEENSIYGDD